MNETIRAAWMLRHGWERRYQREKAAERFWMGLTGLLPRQLRWATWIRVTADATTSAPLSGREVPAIPAGDLLTAVSEKIGPGRRNRTRRVVKRAMTRRTATEVRHRIEEAQGIALAGNALGDADQRTRLRLLRAQAVLDKYGVTMYEKVTQSRHRVARYWRVYADPS